MLRQESSWGLSEVAKSMRGLRGWSPVTDTPHHDHEGIDSGTDVEVDMPLEILKDAGTIAFFKSLCSAEEPTFLPALPLRPHRV